MTTNTNNETVEEQLSSLFGSYKAEWLKEQIFELFWEPEYFPTLRQSRPCLLIGGRGTGKTTVLRCLSYEGQYKLAANQRDTKDWRYFGMYYRVNTNRVAAFKGPELAEKDWIKLFAHYMNLTLCDLLTKLIAWHQIKFPGGSDLSEADYKNIGTSLCIENVHSLRSLSAGLKAATVEFEAFINNIKQDPVPRVSLQGVPVDLMADAMQKLPQFLGKDFFFLIDEYENFEDYQQQVVNTLIKHCGAAYTFKVGVKELGWRCRSTLNPNEQLVSPADYVRIDIAEELKGEKFDAFSLSVCNSRISRIKIGDDKLSDIRSILPRYSEDDEAIELGAKEKAALVCDELRGHPQFAVLAGLHPLKIYFIEFWAKTKNKTVQQSFEDYLSDTSTWDRRFQNYKHALLYTLEARKHIRKFYAGFDVFSLLAGCNIRNLLELVDQSLLLHLKENNNLLTPISPKHQTLAAQRVGKKNLAELEGLSVHGAQLTKLLLGLGRVFGVMASDAVGHAPEVNQFILHDPADQPLQEDDVQNKAEALLRAAVMHLALLRAPGNKLGDEAETRASEYMVHPIYSPFFVFSYRRKRKMRISSAQLLGLVTRPKVAITQILSVTHRSADQDLPDQLMLFENYYSADS